MSDSRPVRSDVGQAALTTHLMGRVVAVRRMKQSTFFDVRDALQDRQCLAGTAEYDRFGIGVGDVVEIEGKLGRSGTGDAVVEVARLTCLAKPFEQESLTMDFRAGALRRTGRSVRRDRARELLVDSELRARLAVRIRVMRSIRESLLTFGFDEVDVPVIVTAPFAGTANLFRLDSADLGSVDLYLRGSLESHLKQLMVAGFENVYCMGPSFRNESAELHEFLMVEGMTSRFSHHELIEIVEKIVQDAVLSVRGFTAVPDSHVEALAVPWRHESFSSITGVVTREKAAVKRAYGELCGPISNGFRSPMFIGEFPAALSPLAKRDESTSGDAMRGFMFFSGFRICEVVQEQVDPEEQRAVFECQRTAMREGRDPQGDSWGYDGSLLEALKLGCPPLSGFGLHVNRLVAAITGVSRVSDVVPFPLASGPIAR